MDRVLMFKEVHADNIETLAGAPQIATLLARFRSLAANGSLPRYAELGPDALPDFAHQLAVVIPEDGDYRYTHYGRAITEESGVDMSGQDGFMVTISDITRPRKPAGSSRP